MILAEIQKELSESGDPETAAFLQKFFKTGRGGYGEGDKFRGIRVPALRRLAKKYQHVTLPEAERLLASPFHEDRLLALLILIRLYAKADRVTRSEIYGLYLRNTGVINNWDLVDASAPYIVGAHLSDKSREPLYRLAGSGDLWERRIAIIATAHFIRRGEFDDTLKIAQMLLTDAVDLIHKAVGWMLREVGKRNAEAEEAFLRLYYKRMPRTMLRYAIEKFSREERRRYMKGEV